MNKDDIFRLKRLVTLQQQAASLSYKKGLADQEALHQRAAELTGKSYSRAPESADPISAGDLRALNQYRLNLRDRARLLMEAAASLDGPIECLRAKTTIALGREAAMEKLMRAARKEIRAVANEREEAAREQITLRGF